ALSLSPLASFSILTPRPPSSPLFPYTTLFRSPLDLESDPPLNSTGRARADLLARFLEYLDVVGGVNAIYAAPYRRAEQTAAPLANRLGLMVRPAVFEDTEAFMEQILDEHKGEIVLFVVDREAIAPMIEELHGSKRVPEIAPKIGRAHV